MYVRQREKCTLALLLFSAHVRKRGAAACMQVRRQFYVYLCVHACSDTRAPSECCRSVCVCFMVHLTFSGAFAFCNLGITTNAAPIKKMIREQRTSSLYAREADAQTLQIEIRTLSSLENYIFLILL